MLKQQTMTPADFDAFADAHPEQRLEFIAGEIVHVPSNAYASYIASVIITILMTFVREHKLGYVTGEGGGYQIGAERYAPDAAFMPRTKQAALDRQGYNTVPPALAVEVISSDRREETDNLRIKVSNYLAAGVVVWVVRPADKIIEVHAPGAAVRLYREPDTLDAAPVLDGLTVPVAEVFAEG